MDLSQYTDYNAAPARDFDPLPAGSYIAEIADMELADTKDGTGKRLNVTWKVLDGQYKNRLVWSGLNIINKSADAQAIAQGLLKSIREAIGKPDAREVDDYRFIPHVIAVKLVPASGNYGPKNEVNGAKPINEGTPAPAPTAAPAAPANRFAPPAQPAPPAGNAPNPWTRR